MSVGCAPEVDPALLSIHKQYRIQAKSIIFIHGLGTDSSIWSGANGNLAPLVSFAKLVGGSAHLFEYPTAYIKDPKVPSLGELARTLRNYIEREELLGKKIVLIAYSAGGVLAQRYILQYPDDHGVDSLILIASPNFGSPQAPSAAIPFQSVQLEELQPYGRNILKMATALEKFRGILPRVLNIIGTRDDVAPKEYSWMNWAGAVNIETDMDHYEIPRVIFDHKISPVIADFIFGGAPPQNFIPSPPPPRTFIYMPGHRAVPMAPLLQVCFTQETASLITSDGVPTLRPHAGPNRVSSREWNEDFIVIDGAQAGEFVLDAKQIFHPSTAIRSGSWVAERLRRMLEAPVTVTVPGGVTIVDLSQ